MTGFGFDYTFGVRPFESGIHGRVSGSGADAMNVQRACVILFWLGEVFRDKKEQKKKKLMKAAVGRVVCCVADLEFA